MSKTAMLVVWLLIWFYMGLIYVWIKTSRMEENIATIADQLQIDIIKVN